ncbi:MAG TPA: HEAT repeat domain-containing protein [Tepidisphaeraceae bacterium]|nr:HEAT repeat domain-containing protein [Tepidisphaeraceae bacterium]
MIANRYGIPAVLLLCLVLAGCAGSGGKQARRTMRAPKSPPPVPPRVDMPIPSSLVAQAKLELNRLAAQSTSPLIRAHAIELMRETSPDDAPPHVLRGLEDPEPVVRFAAALAAGELRLDEAQDRLRQLALEDPDSSVQIAARFALHRLGDTRLSRDLERTARSPDPRTRADTAMVLGLLEEPSGLNILRVMRNDPDPAVRLQVAEAMWRLGEEGALEPLVAATLSLYPDDQMMAIAGLAAAGDRRVLGDLKGSLTTDYEAVNLVAARAMGRLGSDEGYGVALRGVKSRDEKIRMLAALALGAIGRSDSQDELAILLRDANPDVRLAVASAILQLK